MKTYHYQSQIVPIKSWKHSKNVTFNLALFQIGKRLKKYL